MEQNKKGVFEEFLAKAERRMEERKAVRTCLVHLPSMDGNIRIRGLRNSEIAEISDADNSEDPYAGDRYSVYIATVEPDLKEIAKAMKNSGRIREHLEVTEIFEICEIRQMAEKIMELSGVTGKNKVEVVAENLKN